MTQKALTVVIDEWSAAIAAVGRHAPPEVVAQLTAATGDLLEAFGSTATNMAAHEVVGVLRSIAAMQTVQADDAARIGRLEDRTDRRVEDAPHEEERRQ